MSKTRAVVIQDRNELFICTTVRQCRSEKNFDSKESDRCRLFRTACLHIFLPIRRSFPFLLSSYCKGRVLTTTTPRTPKSKLQRICAENITKDNKWTYFETIGSIWFLSSISGDDTLLLVPNVAPLQWESLPSIFTPLRGKIQLHVCKNRTPSQHAAGDFPAGPNKHAASAGPWKKEKRGVHLIEKKRKSNKANGIPRQLNMTPPFYGHYDPSAEKFNTSLQSPRKVAITILLKYGIVMNWEWI